MKILVINGPNLNMLGVREPEIYGSSTLQDVYDLLSEKAHGVCDLKFFQSNHEGAIVDEIQAAYQKFDGILINPAAYTHTSLAIADAIKAVGLPVVEVHISDISAREEFRQISYIKPFAVAQISGLGIAGYAEGLKILVEYIQHE